MRNIFIAGLVYLLAGCTAGPIEITHIDGELPRAHVNMPVDNLHLKAKHDEIVLSYKKRF